ncbi:MAG: ttuD [Rhodospirillaceae bacterium]|nr:MAG: ttuD [Rhodospirillaceae bacterium]
MPETKYPFAVTYGLPTCTRYTRRLPPGLRRRQSFYEPCLPWRSRWFRHERCLLPPVPAVPHGRTMVVGAGKAAAAMARVVDDSWTASLSGLVVTRYGYGVPAGRVEVVEAGHPLPDKSSLHATRRILDLASSLTEEELLLCPSSRGRLSPFDGPASGFHAARQAGHCAGSFAEWRTDCRDQLCAQASLGCQGRAAGHCRPGPAQVVDTGHLRCPRRMIRP